jgi:hypothetical protein
MKTPEFEFLSSASHRPVSLFRPNGQFRRVRRPVVDLSHKRAPPARDPPAPSHDSSALLRVTDAKNHYVSVTPGAEENCIPAHEYLN